MNKREHEYTIDGQKMTAGQAWETYVGQQTPEEFMRIGGERAIENYVRDCPVRGLCNSESTVELARALRECVERQ